MRIPGLALAVLLAAPAPRSHAAGSGGLGSVIGAVTQTVQQDAKSGMFKDLADQFKAKAAPYLSALGKCQDDACRMGVGIQALTEARGMFDAEQAKLGLPTSGQLRQAITAQVQACEAAEDKNACYQNLGQNALNFARDQINAYKQFVPPEILSAFGNLDAKRAELVMSARQCALMQGSDEERLQCLKDAAQQNTNLLDQVPL